MLKTRKFRICPNKIQEKKMEQSLELCRRVYNRTLAERKQAYEESGKTLSKYTLNKLLPQWKAEHMNVVAVVLLWTGTTMQLSTFSDWDYNLSVLNP